MNSGIFRILFRKPNNRKFLLFHSLGLGISTCPPQSTEVFYLDDGETKIGPIEKVYVTTLVTPMGLASSFNGGILKIIAKK